MPTARPSIRLLGREEDLRIQTPFVGASGAQGGDGPRGPASYLVDAWVGNVVLLRLQNTNTAETQLGWGLHPLLTSSLPRMLHRSASHLGWEWGWGRVISPGLVWG